MGQTTEPTFEGASSEGVSLVSSPGADVVATPPVETAAATSSVEEPRFDSVALWKDAVAHTRTRSPGSFDQWFSGVQFDGMVDGIVSIRARDEFVKSWVDDHFAHALAERIRMHTGWSVQFAWAIDSSLDSPVVPAAPKSPVDVKPSAPPTARDAAPIGVHDLAKSSDDVVSRPSSSATVDPQRPVARSSVELVATPVPGLNTKYTFSNFIVGPSNQLAHAAAIGAAGGGGRRHNPLFICGGTGLGKTHLVHAVAHRVHQERPSALIVYVSAERFVNEFVQALSDHRMGEFRAKYRERV
ncbi:MAG: DnaA/Hda family protein [Polyangiaceae bacterium]